MTPHPVITSGDEGKVWWTAHGNSRLSQRVWHWPRWLVNLLGACPGVLCCKRHWRQSSQETCDSPHDQLLWNGDVPSGEAVVRAYQTQHVVLHRSIGEALRTLRSKANGSYPTLQVQILLSGSLFWMNTEVFRDELGLLQDVKVSLQVTADAKPLYHRPRPVPFLFSSCETRRQTTPPEWGSGPHHLATCL